MPISFRNVVTIVALSLVATSCIKSEIVIDVNNDQSAEVTTIVAYDAEQLGGLAELGDADLGDLDFCQETFDGLAQEQADGVEVEEYNEDGFCGAKITAQVEASGDINQAIQDSLQGSDELASGEQEINLEKIADDEWNFTVELEEGGLAGAIEDSGELDGMEGMFGAVLDEFEVKYVVSLPGSETSSNADEVSTSGDKTTFTWALGLDSTLSELTASTEPGGGFDAGILLWIGLVILGLLLLGAVFMFLKSRKKTDPVFDQHGYQTGVAPSAPPAGQQQFQQHTPQQTMAPPTAVPPVDSPVVDPLDPYTPVNGESEAPVAESEVQSSDSSAEQGSTDSADAEMPKDTDPKDS